MNQSQKMTLAIITTAVVVGGAVYLLVKSPSAAPASREVEVSTRNVYRNEQYRYEISYPLTAGVRTITAANWPKYLVHRIEIDDPADVRSASLEIVHVSVWSDDQSLKGLETNYAAEKTVTKTEKQVDGLPATIYYGQRPNDVGGMMSVLDVWIPAGQYLYQIDLSGIDSDPESPKVKAYLDSFKVL